MQGDGQESLAWKANANDVVGRDDTLAITRRIAVGAACLPVDTSGSTILLQCTDMPPAARPVLASISDGSVAAVQTPNFTFDQYLSLGREWLAGQDCAPPGCVGIFLSRSTGEYRQLASPGLRDLDDPMLRTRAAAGAPYLRYVRNSSGQSQLQLVTKQRTVTLSACKTSCSLESYGANHVTWLQGNAIYDYQLNTARTSKQGIPAGGHVRGLVHTRSAIYAGIDTAGTSSDFYRLYRLPYRSG